MEDAALLRAVLQILPQSVVAVDEDLIIRSVSSQAEKLLEIKEDMLSGRHIKDCGLLGKAGLEDLVGTLKNGTEHSITCYLYGEENVKTPIKLLTRRLTDQTGKTLGAAIILETPDRQGEVEMTVNREKIEMMKHMAAGIAHHIRNSLTAVRGFVQMMQGKSNGESIRGFAEFSNIAVKEMDRVNDVISNILHLADSNELKKESVNVKNLLENVIAFIKGKAALSGVLIVKEIAPGLPEPEVDVVRIINALFNILDNALKAMPDGGRLLLRAYPVSGEKLLCIEVADSGAGIPAENLKYIFDPFFTSREESMGFGLSLANKILYDHGGHIRVTSEEGKGSTFFVYLPV